MRFLRRRFLRKLFARPPKPTLNEHVELVYRRTWADVEPLVRRPGDDDVNAAA
jgi:hypothetical protein